METTSKMAGKWVACLAVLLLRLAAVAGVLVEGIDDINITLPSACQLQIRQKAMDFNSLEMFAWGLQQVDLDEFGIDDGNFTVFAAADDGVDPKFMSDVEVAKEIVKYHVVRGFFWSENLVDGTELETLLVNESSCGVDKLVVKNNGSEMFITGAGIEAKIVLYNVRVCDDAFHIVDKLLVPCPKRLAAVATEDDDDNDDGTQARRTPGSGGNNGGRSASSGSPGQG